MTSFNPSGDFVAARPGVVRMLHASGGWDTKLLSKQAAAAPPMYCYAVRFGPSSPTPVWMWMVQCVADDFYRLAEQSVARPSDAPVVHAILGQLFESSTSEQRESGNSRWGVETAVAMAAYAGTTETYVHMKNRKKINHFLVMHYERSKMLRPFAAVHRGGLSGAMPVEEVHARACEVFQIDNARHPEWVK